MSDILRSIERTPAFVVEYDKFKRNVDLIDSLQQDAPVQFLLALKGFAMFSLFDDISSVVRGATASSLNEARLASSYFNEVHTYAPAYHPREVKEIASIATHMSFNSVAQYEMHRSLLTHTQAGLRINPEYSTVETDLYNPCTPGSRLGVPSSELTTLPEGISGLHSHNLCENGAFELQQTLKQIETLYKEHLSSISWLNLGGGHLVTKEGYDTQLFIRTLSEFKERYPHIELIVEPGAAFVWQTGVLVATVLDIVSNNGVKTAMLDTSFATHMPDTLEMPYTPTLRDATIAKGGLRLGGASCLAGDWVGEYSFNSPLQVGDRLIFEDMIHYTMVKTTTFNGVNLPDIAILQDGKIKVVKEFGYEDYRSRLS